MTASRFTFADLMVLAIACVLLTAIGVPMSREAREYANNIKCASNLKQIAEALINYTRQNRGNYPRAMAALDPTTWTAYTSPLASDPFASGGPAANDVTAAMFLLLRTQAMRPEVFVCPLTRAIKTWDFGGAPRTAADCSNFPSGMYLSYSYANPYPSAAAVAKGYKLNSSISAEFAVMADMNPGVPALLTMSPDATKTEMKRVNSANHYRGDGQVVLFGDAHAEYLQTPFVGVQRDNIYTHGGAKSKAGWGIIGSPVDANDTVLLPLATVDPESSRYKPGEAPYWLFLAVFGFMAVVLVGIVMLGRYLLRRRAPRPAI